MNSSQNSAIQILESSNNELTENRPSAPMTSGQQYYTMPQNDNNNIINDFVMEDYDTAIVNQQRKSIINEMDTNEINCLDESAFLRNGIQRLNKIT